ncbi:hypothetical protein ACJMK2_008169 [Sinanodonta woodiana]|uniref:Uncharacterized protein n=1 Tax=Sinanodonta woodiana TaxID=1069815 RepID=A0ABD3VL04_SINWO
MSHNHISFQKGLIFQEKQYQLKLQKKQDLPDGDIKKGTEKKIMSLQKKFSMNRELIDQVCLSYQTVLEEERCTRHEMQQLSEALQQQTVAMARDKLTEYVDLLEMASLPCKIVLFNYSIEVAGIPTKYTHAQFDFSHSLKT